MEILGVILLVGATLGWGASIVLPLRTSNKRQRELEQEQQRLLPFAAENDWTMVGVSGGSILDVIDLAVTQVGQPGDLRSVGKLEGEKGRRRSLGGGRNGNWVGGTRLFKYSDETLLLLSSWFRESDNDHKTVAVAQLDLFLDLYTFDRESNRRTNEWGQAPAWGVNLSEWSKRWKGPFRLRVTKEFLLLYVSQPLTPELINELDDVLGFFLEELKGIGGIHPLR